MRRVFGIKGELKEKTVVSSLGLHAAYADDRGSSLYSYICSIFFSEDRVNRHHIIGTLEVFGIHLCLPAEDKQFASRK